MSAQFVPSFEPCTMYGGIRIWSGVLASVKLVSVTSKRYTGVTCIVVGVTMVPVSVGAVATGSGAGGLTVIVQNP